MPVGNEEIKRRYLKVQDGNLVEYNGRDVFNTYTHVSRVHLVNATFREIKKDRNVNDSPIIGHNLQLHLIDQNDYFVLEMWYNSSYAKCFYNLMENIDLLQEVSIFGNEKLVDGKKRQSLFIKQNGAFLKHRYTKDNMGNCPNLQESFIADATAPGGQKRVLNDDLQMAFYLDRVKEYLIPKLEKKLNPYPNHMIFTGIVGPKVAGNHFNDAAPASGDTNDDLPF